MPKCKITQEPVRTKDRTYVNGETLEDNEAVIAGLVNAGVAVRIFDESKFETKPVVEETKPVIETAKPPVEHSTARRRRQQAEETEEVE